jgi:hypothetical protein
MEKLKWCSIKRPRKHTRSEIAFQVPSHSLEAIVLYAIVFICKFHIFLSVQDRARIGEDPTTIL